jgi:hypothetical protein
MKKLLSILLCCTTFYSTFAQITVSNVTRKEEPISNKVIPYDSTKNWLGNKNVKSYIGQTLYVNGKSSRLKELGYDYFFIMKEPSYSLPNRGRWGEPAADHQGRTKYEDLFGKYFIVIDVQADSEQDKYSYKENTWWFKLQNKDNIEEVTWFEYNGRFKHRFPFITVSYFNYVKKILVGNKYIFRYRIDEGKVNEFLINNTDFYTGETFIESKENLWECIDITIEGEFYKLVALLKNQNGIISCVDIDNLLKNKEEGDNSYLFEISKYNALVNKWGKGYMDIVRRKEIKVGMPKSLLLLSWGEPDRINSSSYGPDQYVYGNQYVYIENGVIKAWN